MMLMDIEKILSYLPHRQPFMLIDRVLEYEKFARIVAIKNVTYNEPFFNGHFPHQPLMPGVLIIEAMAQAAGVLAYKSGEDIIAPENLIFYFAGIDKARFKRMVVPGDQLRLEINVIKSKKGIWKFHGAATVDGQLACEAELMCAQREIERDS